MAFRCEACGAEFDTQEELDAHVRAEHGEHKEHTTGGFRCEACGAEFDTQEELDAHVKAEHGA
jgi:uncharacterized C2H2 Zn-finger protein